MNKDYILDENNEPQVCDNIKKWGEWFRDNDRTIAKDDIGNVQISTVFLGFDHRFGPGDPILYETMIFGGEHDQYQDRYCTREEALKGHQEAIDKVTGAKLGGSGEK